MNTHGPSPFPSPPRSASLSSNNKNKYCSVSPRKKLSILSAFLPPIPFPLPSICSPATLLPTPTSSNPAHPHLPQHLSPTSSKAICPTRRYHVSPVAFHKKYVLSTSSGLPGHHPIPPSTSPSRTFHLSGEAAYRAHSAVGRRCASSAADTSPANTSNPG